MTRHPTTKGGWRSGWILASGLLTLCILGTWMTARTYRAQVITSISAVVLENQWPESRIRATFPENVSEHIKPGMMARITVGEDKTLLTGSVLSSGSDGVIVALRGEAGNAGRLTLSAQQSTSGKPHHYLPSGVSCIVTLDASIPPEAIAPATPSASPAR